MQSLITFAALKADGRVLTWGNPRNGGDSSKVQRQLEDVQSLGKKLGSRFCLRRHPGESVAHAVDKLLQSFEKRRGGVLLSLDYVKCFDMVDPQLGIMCLRHFGCPNEILFALRQVWDQNRWLCFRRDCLPNPVHVTTSIPQGDAISPLTLLALLTGLTGRVLQERTEPHTLATFLDDRNLVAKTPEDAAKLWKTWKELSPRVGLQENDAKVQVVPRAADFKPRLLQAGFSENQIADSARVLGVDITARLNATHRPTKETRIQETHARLERIGLLPVSADVKPP